MAVRLGRNADAYTRDMPVLVKGQPPRVVRTRPVWVIPLGGAWRLLPVAEHGHVRRDSPTRTRSRSCKSPRGRCLAAAVKVTGETMH